MSKAKKLYKFGGPLGYKTQIVNPYTNRQVQSFAAGGPTDPPTETPTETPTKSMSELLYELAAGGDGKSYGDFNDLDTKIREVESFGGEKTTNKDSTAKGAYQYLDASVPTAIQRFYNILEANNITEGPLMDEYNSMKGKAIPDLSDEQQKIMMLSDFIEGPNAPFKSWRAGETEDFDLWQNGHFAAKKLTDELRGQNTKNWAGATTRLEAKAKEAAALNVKAAPEIPQISSALPPITNNKLPPFLGDNTLQNGGSFDASLLGNGQTNNPSVGIGMDSFGSSGVGVGLDATTFGGGVGANVMNVSPTDVGLMNGSGAGAGITGGVLQKLPGDLAGANSGATSNLGIISAVSGGLSSISKPIAAAMDEKYKVENAGATMQNYDTSAGISNSTSKQMNKDRNKRMAIYDGLDSVPILGGIYAANRMFDDDSSTTLDDNGYKRFTSKYMSSDGWFGGYDKRVAEDKAAEERKISDEYNSLVTTHYAQSNANSVASAFGNERAAPRVVPYGGSVSGDGGDIQSIQIPMDHKNNKFKGVKIGEDSEGNPNLAEVGEEVYKDFVFTNRF